MKKNTLKAILIILIIVLLGLVSFGGIYVKNLNSMKNIVKGYNYGMDFSKTALISLKVAEETKDTEQAEQSEETEQTEQTAEEKVINKKDIESAKEKIKHRLQAIGVEEFYIRANYADGRMLIEIPGETDMPSITDIVAIGDFKIVDNDSNVLGDSGVIKDVKYSLDKTSYSVPCVEIIIEFKNDFVKKLINEKSQFEDTTDETGNTVERTINLKVDDNSIYSAKGKQFIDTIKLNNAITLYLGNSNSTEEELMQYYNSSAVISTIIKDGKMPLNYQIDRTNVTTPNLSINSIVIVGLIILGIVTIFAIYKYKGQGVIVIISLIGYIAIMLLLVRYTNVILALEGIVALALIFGIEYVFNIKLSKNFINNEKSIKVYSKTLMQFLNIIVVSFIIAIVFSMQTWVPIRSFGTIMFWGMIIMVAYNYLVTKNLIESVKNK